MGVVVINIRLKAVLSPATIDFYSAFAFLAFYCHQETKIAGSNFHSVRNRLNGDDYVS